MIKNYLLLSFFLIVATSFSQEKIKFKPSVQILENEKSSDYKTPTTLLFVFQGTEHSSKFFRDLENNIRRQFRKQLKKDNKKLKLKFSVDMWSKQRLKNDQEKIPSKKYKKEKHETVCYVSISNFKGWDSHLLEKRKQNYALNLKMVHWKTDQTKLKLKLNVHSYWTILTQNKNSSKLIVDAILN